MLGAFACIAYKAVEILFMTPWTAYDTFCIEVAHGMSKATLGSFLMMRVIMLVEFIMLPLPVFCFVAKVIEWSGDYIWLSFLVATSIVELFLVWIYPRVIKPLTSSKKPMPDKYGILKS